MSVENRFKFLDPGSLVDRELELVVGGTFPGDSARGLVPAYRFDIRKLGNPQRRGYIDLRIGATEAIVMYGGQIGYRVEPPFRGHRYAARGCRLLFPLMRDHGINPVWITCNPDNLASRRTLELIGAEFVETVPVPRDNDMYKRGDHFKCRYRIDL